MSARTTETTPTGPDHRISDSTMAIERSTAGTDPNIAYTLVESANAISNLTLILLNGAAHKRDCWFKWAEHFARRGMSSVTLDYRGHGESTWSEPVHHATLDQEVADVATVLEALGLDARLVVLVGHSYGGAVAQRYAEQHEVAGLVLMATLALGRWKPEVFAQMPGQLLKHPRVYPKLRTDPSQLFATVERAREYLFDRNTPEETVQWYLDHCWCPDSGRAMSDMIAAKPQPLRAKRVLFLAGRQDASLPLRSIRASAAWVHAPLIELDVPHDGMLAGDWQGAADVVWAFVQQCQEMLAQRSA